jgi:hypothetical protein
LKASWQSGAHGKQSIRNQRHSGGIRPNSERSQKNAKNRPNLWIIGIEGEEIQTKGIDNLLDRIIAKNYPNLEKDGVNNVQEAHRTLNPQNKKKHSQTHHNQNIEQTEWRKNTESCNREHTSHIQSQIHRIISDYSTQMLNRKT